MFLLQKVFNKWDSLNLQHINEKYNSLKLWNLEYRDGFGKHIFQDEQDEERRRLKKTFPLYHKTEGKKN